MHGDYRLDNVLVVGEGERPRVSAILDWEMATLGDPLLDLGIFALYWDIDCSLGPLGGALSSAVDSAAGYPTFGELLAVYAERAGIRLPDLRWYRAFAAYKLGVIAEGIHVRFLAGKTVGEGFDRLGDLVEPLAQHGLAQLEETLMDFAPDARAVELTERARAFVVEHAQPAERVLDVSSRRALAPGAALR